jgi:hypothetical protein
MTTAAKPLPPHGSYARANGSPGRRPGCDCQPCIKERRRVGKRNEVNRQLGRPATVPAAPARAHLHKLHIHMGWKTLATRTRLDYRTLVQIYRGERITIRRTTAQKILTVPAADNRDAGIYLDATGSIRRVRALQAIGHSTQTIADACKTGRAKIELIVNGKQPTVREMLASKIRHAYSHLSEQPGRSVRGRNRAHREGWAPPGAWDDIDDPAAMPDWTGHCGADRGWWLHSINNIPACARCQEAHDGWLAERRDLPAAERWRQLALAKGAASNRGAILAADARELMRITGLTTEQAAERLGVTKAHLYQELLRHPEADEPAVAAELAA